MDSSIQNIIGNPPDTNGGSNTSVVAELSSILHSDSSPRERRPTAPRDYHAPDGPYIGADTTTSTKSSNGANITASSSKHARTPSTTTTTTTSVGPTKRRARRRRDSTTNTATHTAAAQDVPNTRPVRDKKPVERLHIFSTKEKSYATSATQKPAVPKIAAVAKEIAIVLDTADQEPLNVSFKSNAKERTKPNTGLNGVATKKIVVVNDAADQAPQNVENDAAEQVQPPNVGVMPHPNAKKKKKTKPNTGSSGVGAKNTCALCANQVKLKLQGSIIKEHMFGNTRCEASNDSAEIYIRQEPHDHNAKNQIHASPSINSTLLNLTRIDLKRFAVELERVLKYEGMHQSTHERQTVTNFERARLSLERKGTHKQIGKTLSQSPPISLKSKEDIEKLMEKYPTSQVKLKVKTGKGGGAGYIALKVTYEEVKEAIESSLHQSDSPGPMKSITLSAVCEQFNDRKFAEVLRRIVEGIINNSLPSQVLCMLGTSSGMILSKPNSTSVRPIAIGNVFFKLAERVVITRTNTRIKQVIGEYDFGAFKDGGSETVVHLVRTMCKQKGMMYAIQADIENAFNAISRVELEKILKEFLPEWLGIFYASYGDGNVIFFDDFSRFPGGKSFALKILQSRGLKQGSPLSAILFTIALSIRLKPIREKYKGEATIPGFADDLTILAKSAVVSKQAFLDLCNVLEVLDLKISFQKSSVCAINGTNDECATLAAELKISQVNSIYLLGAIAFSHDPEATVMERLIAPYVKKVEAFTNFLKVLLKEEANLEVDADEMDPLEKTHLNEVKKSRIDGLLAKLFQAFLAGPAQSNTYLLRVMPPSWSKTVWDMMDSTFAKFFAELLLVQPKSIVLHKKDNTSEKLEYTPFRVQRDEIVTLFNLPNFARGGEIDLDSVEFPSERRAQLARWFLPLRDGGAGLPNSQTRAIAGFTASTHACLNVVVRIAQEMFPHIKDVHGRVSAIASVKRELAIACQLTKNYPPAKEKYLSLRDKLKVDLNVNLASGSKHRLQATTVRIFNLVTQERFIRTLSVPSHDNEKAVRKAALKVSSFVSSSSRASYQFTLANQNFVGNRLTSEEFRGAFLKHVGLDPPLHEVCLVCMESYEGMGAFHHSTSCSRIRPASNGKYVKDALCLGLKASFGVSIPRGEPVLANQPGVSRKPGAVELDETKQAKVNLERADFLISSCGTTFIVDSTSGVALPKGILAKAMRNAGLHASFIEANKRLEYKEWRFGYPNEFIPFAMDNTGMLSKTSIRFLHRMKLHAKRMDRFRGLTRFWEALSIGLAKGSAHGFALMARGDGVPR